jgi:two-component sensor histidine kinase
MKKTTKITKTQSILQTNNHQTIKNNHQIISTIKIINLQTINNKITSKVKGMLDGIWI